MASALVIFLPVDGRVDEGYVGSRRREGAGSMSLRPTTPFNSARLRTPYEKGMAHAGTPVCAMGTGRAAAKWCDSSTPRFSRIDDARIREIVAPRAPFCRGKFGPLVAMHFRAGGHARSSATSRSDGEVLVRLI